MVRREGGREGQGASVKHCVDPEQHLVDEAQQLRADGGGGLREGRVREGRQDRIVRSLLVGREEGDIAGVIEFAVQVHRDQRKEGSHMEEGGGDAFQVVFARFTFV